MLGPSNIWMNVLNAVLIRDVKVRSGPYFVGYFFIFSMPLLHLVAVLTFFSIFDRIAPFGTSNIVYYGVSILPFVIFRYPSLQIMQSISSNAPLLYFSRVKLSDIIFARGALEVANGLLVSVLVLGLIGLWSGDFHPENPFMMLYALTCTLVFGFAVGAMSALIAQVFPMWPYLFSVSYIFFWIGSGIIFYPHSVPEPYYSYLHYNPLLICIESLRFSYYFSYPDEFVRLDFVLWTSFVMFGISLIFDRLGRRHLLTA